jgi:hypothetical protein
MGQTLQRTMPDLRAALPMPQAMLQIRTSGLHLLASQILPAATMKMMKKKKKVMVMTMRCFENEGRPNAIYTIESCCWILAVGDTPCNTLTR